MRLVASFVWVCGTYVVHHCKSTVHHRAALCTIDLYCAPWCTRETYFFKVASTPNNFHFLVVHMKHAENGHFLSVFVGSQGQTTDTC